MSKLTSVSKVLCINCKYCKITKMPKWKTIIYECSKSKNTFRLDEPQNYADLKCYRKKFKKKVKNG